MTQLRKISFPGKNSESRTKHRYWNKLVLVLGAVVARNRETDGNAWEKSEVSSVEKDNAETKNIRVRSRPPLETSGIRKKWTHNGNTPISSAYLIVDDSWLAGTVVKDRGLVVVART